MKLKLIRSRLFAVFALSLMLGLAGCIGGGSGGGGSGGAGGPVDTIAPAVSSTPSSGTYAGVQSVVLSADETATIYYTINGSTPTVASSVYSGAISVSSNTTIKFFARDLAGNSSSVATVNITIGIDTTEPTVAASPVGGVFDTVQFVSLLANETATVYYTTNGNTPTISSNVYTSPITVSSTTTIKFFGKDTAGNSSSVSSQTYTIDSTLPAVAANPPAGTYSGTQFVSLVSSKSGSIYYTIDGSAPSISSATYTSPIRISPNSTVILKYFAKDLLGNVGVISTQTYTTGNTITEVKIESTDPALGQTEIPFTFGQVFAVGDLAPTDGLNGTLGTGGVIPLQVNVKATHGDGSVRHAIISGKLSALAAASIQTVELKKTTLSAPGTLPTPADLVTAGLTGSVKITLGGVQYETNLESLLSTASSTTWLTGPIANEWIVAGPLKTVSGGVAHPHLHAQFAIRAYTGLSKIKVDVTVENGWAYEPNPQDFTYDAQIFVNGVSVYSKAALTHFHHTRWRKVFWSGAEPLAHIKHNTSYLIASKAVPNYDQTIVVSSATIATQQSAYDISQNAPMGSGIALNYMPNTGGRPDIGIIPAWGVTYLLSMDKRAKDIALGQADLSGSWPVHYRDSVSGRPISIGDYPNMTLYPASADSFNASQGRNEAMPNCTAVCNNPNVPDTAHQPAFNYLPYIVTGDYYQLEQMLFYAMWNVGSGNPTYRENGKGLVHWDQLRAQAWTLRSVSDAAYILPDADPMKLHLQSVLTENITWFNAAYTNNINANALGAVINGFAFSYNSETGIAPWQDDFFTAVIGRASERGFSGASSLLNWKSKFSVGRMTAAGYCWINASSYIAIIRPTNVSPVYSTFAEVYQATFTPAMRATTCGSAEMAAVIQAEIGTPMIAGAMSGFPSFEMGFPADMQPALAFAKDSGITNSSLAWSLFDQRKLKPDYSLGPQFAIIPR